MSLLTDAEKTTGYGVSPLALPGWLEFNRQKWGVTPVPMHFARPGAVLPSVDTVWYQRADGRLVLPPGNPYLPVHFQPTSTQAIPRLHRQWLEVSELIAQAMRGRGLANTLVLAPEVLDARLWQWEHFRVGVRYTFHLELPHDEKRADPAIRQNIAKADRLGYRSERTAAPELAYACLVDSEVRKGFTHRLRPEDLRLAMALLGEDHFRIYLSHAPNGAPASATVVLHTPGSRALIWLAGTRSDHLHQGATQQLFRFVLDDLAAAGARGCDFVGANLPGVALQKSKWGGTLVPFVTLEAPGFKGLARYLADAWAYHRREKQLCLKGF